MSWWNGQEIQGYYWSWVPPVIGWRKHSGIDLGMALGTPITCPAPGTLIGHGCHPWGWQSDVRINYSGHTYVLTFLHLREGNAALKVGDQVNPGDLLGYSGGAPSGPCPTDSQYSKQPHLHFEMTYGSNAPYTSAYNPWQPSLSQHPVDPTNVWHDIQRGNGVLGGATNPSTGAGSQSPGQAAHSLLVEVPGFDGIVYALDAIEQFEPFAPPSSINPLDKFGYALTWTARNSMVFGIRLAIIGVGLLLFYALVLSLIAANRYVQQAGQLALPLAMGAL